MAIVVARWFFSMDGLGICSDHQALISRCDLVDDGCCLLTLSPHGGVVCDGILFAWQGGSCCLCSSVVVMVSSCSMRGSGYGL